MTINKAMQLEIVNNELATVLLGLVARVTAFREHLKECDHEHVKATAMLTTFQAEELLQKVSPEFTESMVAQSIQDMADAETQAEQEPFLMRYAKPVDQSQADYVKERLEGVFVKAPSICSNPNCVDGLAPRKTGPNDGDVDMEPCPVCGGPQ